MILVPFLVFISKEISYWSSSGISKSRPKTFFFVFDFGFFSLSLRFLELEFYLIIWRMLSFDSCYKL